MSDRGPWDALLTCLERELEATGEPDRGPLCCELALLCWDSLGDQAGAEQWLLRADAYVPAALLRRQLLLAQGDAARAAALLEVLVGRTSDPSLAVPLMVDAALLRLLWSGDAKGAADVCRQALRLGPPDPQLAEVAALALTAAEDYPSFVDLARAGEPSVPTLVAAGLVLREQLKRPEESAGLLRQAFALDDGDPFTLELLLELDATLHDDQGRALLLAKKLEILDRQDRASAEGLAVALDLARLLGAQGRTTEAAALLARFERRAKDPDTTDPVFVSPVAWGEMVLLGARREQAVRAGDLALLAHVYGELAHASRVPAMTRVYRLRTAQILDQLGDAGVEALLLANVEDNPADLHSQRTLEQHRLRRGQQSSLCSQLEAQAAASPEHKGLLLRRAAILAEAHLKDLSLAASLRRDGLAVLPDPLGHGDLQRLYRASPSPARLSEAYEREADSGADPAQVALLCGIVAALRFDQQQSDGAEDAAREALRARPDDPLALGLLAMIYRTTQREADLMHIVRHQAECLVAPENRAACLRQLAGMSSLAAEAKDYLAQALQLQSGDAAILADLAANCERTESYEEAQRWWQELAETLRHQPARAAEALVKVGQISQRNLADRPRAIAAYTQALTHDPRSLAALRGLTDAHREQGEPGPLLEALRRLVDVEPDELVRGSLLLEAARLVEQRGGTTEEVLDSYGAAARASGGEAVAELERVCRREKRFDFLAEVLGELPPTAGNLEVLARGLREVGDLETLCSVQQQLVDMAVGPLERADRAYELGEIFERLGQARKAVASYQDVVEELPGHRPALLALERIYRQEGRTTALALTLEQELAVAHEPERRVEALLELGQALVVLGQPDRAAARFEELLQLRSGHVEALLALEKLYDPGQPLELARVLDLHAEATADPAERAAFCLRAGQLLVGSGADDRAGEALWRAFMHDPGNRDAFTSYEAFCYKRERWHALMELYARAISFVEEEGEARAYRPVDLWVRRGQLQLKYLGQPGEAAASYLKALEHDPKSEATMKMLESIFVQQQDWLGLVRAYEHRAELVPNNELFRLESLRQAARLAGSRLPHQPEEVLRLWEAIYKTDPIDEDALDNLEQLYEQEQQFEKLVDLLETRSALLPQEEETIPLRRRVAQLCEMELENPERAARAYEGIRQIHEHNEEALKALARIYEATGQWAHCLEVLKDLVIMEADPDERSLLYFKCGSIVETRFSNDEQAIEYYESALGESQGCLPAVHGLRDLYLRREEWNKVLETLELESELWEEKREQAGILARMGEIRLHHLKDARKALEHYEAAIAIDADCQPASLALFNLYFERGDAAKALALSEGLTLRMAREGDPEERSRFYNRRGQLLVGAGQLHAAAESLVIALELRPKNLEALDWLIALCRRSPDAYDFATVFRELEQVYRREDDTAAVGHVLVAAGALSEIVGDAETALARYQEAVEAAPSDLTPVKSLADLLIRLRRTDEAMTALRQFVDRSTEVKTKLKALLRLGDTWSNVVLDAERAITVYQEALALDPLSNEAADHLAQEYYVVGRLSEAQTTMGGLIERVSHDGSARNPALARYEHYLGVILLKMGEAPRAVEQFRRALQLDSRNAAATMALARQLVLGGDRPGAERLLRGAIDGLGGRTGSTTLQDLQRSLAGVYLGGNDLEAALACHEAVLRDSGKFEDRLALAETLALQPQRIGQAITELKQVLEDDTLNPHPLRLLADLHERSGNRERAAQGLQAIEVSGWATAEDQARLTALRRQIGSRAVVTIDGQTHVELAPSTDPHVQRLWTSMRDPLERLFPLETGSSKPVLAEQVGHPQFRQLVDWCVRLFGINATVLVGGDVPGGVLVGSDGRLVVDRLFLDRPVAEVAFVLGRTLEYLYTGCALLSRLAFDDRQLLEELLVGLLQPPEASNDLVQEFRRGLPRRALKELDAVLLAYREHLKSGGEAEQPPRWLAGIDRLANNVGLLTCDDLSAALRVLAQLAGQEPTVGPRGEVAARLIPDGPELVRFFLSDRYFDLRRRLAV